MNSIKKAKKIHFIGVGGSGISGIAVMAKKAGYEVTGCDLEEDTPYIDKVKKEGTKCSVGHDKEHLEDVDLAVTTPSVFYVSGDHPEIKAAKDKRILVTWQEFVGKYLHKDMKVICVAGTHGKSTTTALAGLVFKNAGKDPSVLVGATVKKWDANFCVGKGDVFINEADEFYDNFLNYHPDVIILNNIEFDHPDFFKSEKQLFESFEKFVKNLRGQKVLIINQDNEGIKELLDKLGDEVVSGLRVIGYSLKSPVIEPQDSFMTKIVSKNKSETKFSVKNTQRDFDEEFTIKIPGEYNVSNALGVIALSSIFDIKTSIVKKTLNSYSGLGRRLDLIGENNDIKIYDDYAHHPTAINVTLSALRQRHPDNRIWAVVEPHSYSRTKALLSEYEDAFKDADKVIIGPVFKARDKEKFGVNSQSIVKVSHHNDIKFIPTDEQIVHKLKKELKEGDVVIVMGAGKSYQWARDIKKII